MVPAASEPDIPFVVGEWDFMLGKGYPSQFRGVEVVGLTDYHDAKDPQMPGGPTAALDIEVKYQLDEVFNPWSLVDAVHKATSRYVEFVPGPKSSGAVISLGEPLVDYDWNAYCSFAERVLLLPDGILWKRGTQYRLWDADEDGAYDSIKLLTSVASGKTLKILYSTSNYWERTEEIVFEFFATGDYLYDGDYEAWTDPLGVTHKAVVDGIEITVVDYADEDFEETFHWTLYGWEADFKVFKGNTYTCSWDYTEPMLQEGDYADVSLDFLDIHWIITAPATEDVHVWKLGFKATVTVTISYNATEEEMNITATVTLTPPVGYAFNVLYSETVPGRYE